ncbi:hypothetical protein CC78DRAFT_581469 [Lojkania enalia]|uniref:Uncharacterized protein n=1 Tax=Lojkania enalia TaxID=147567 RepID=A0A9P4N800_9PLEO|nr:hypothetical protein CC78DRAFT_581469 [Didymosphaeria enalia]
MHSKASGLQMPEFGYIVFTINIQHCLSPNSHNDQPSPPPYISAPTNSTFLIPDQANSPSTPTIKYQSIKMCQLQRVAYRDCACTRLEFLPGSGPCLSARRLGSTYTRVNSFCLGGNNIIRETQSEGLCARSHGCFPPKDISPDHKQALSCYQQRLSQIESDLSSLYNRIKKALDNTRCEIPRPDFEKNERKYTDLQFQRMDLNNRALLALEVGCMASEKLKEASIASSAAIISMSADEIRNSNLVHLVAKAFGPVQTWIEGVADDFEKTVLDLERDARAFNDAIEDFKDQKVFKECRQDMEAIDMGNKIVKDDGFDIDIYGDDALYEDLR